MSISLYKRRHFFSFKNMDEFLYNLGMEKALLIIIQNPDLKKKKNVVKILKQNSFVAKRSESQKISNKLGKSIFNIHHR